MEEKSYTAGDSVPGVTDVTPPVSAPSSAAPPVLTSLPPFGPAPASTDTPRSPVPPATPATVPVAAPTSAVVAASEVFKPASRLLAPFSSPRFKPLLIAALFIIGLGLAGFLGYKQLSSQGQQNAISADPATAYDIQKLDLQDLADTSSLGLVTSQSLSVNGQLRTNNSLVLAPTAQPSATSATAGQLYYDRDGNVLAYYNGTQFVDVASAEQFETLQTQIQTVSGSIPATPALPGDLATLGATNTFQNLNTFSGGLASSSLATGSLSVASSANLQGSLTVTGNTNLGPTTASSLVLAAPLAVSSGGTGANSLTTNGILIGQGSSPIGAVTASAPDLCLMSTAGAPVFDVCPGGVGSGVNELNNLTGNLTLLNATGTGTTITIDNASATAKGIASFNATNFSVSGGAVNTVQDIATTATPTFAGLTLATDLAVTQGGTGASSFTANGIVIGNGASALSTIAAGSTGQCLIANTGSAPSFQSCPTTTIPAHVSSLNGLTGALTLNNATGSGTSLTINDASTTNKGIASFNSTNFSISGGAVNTIQNIHSAATPTFAGINTGSVVSAGALTVASATNTNLTLNAAGTGNLYLTGYDCSASGGGGKLTVDATGQVICGADGDTDTTGITSIVAGNGIAVSGNQVSVQLHSGYGLAFDAASPNGLGLQACTLDQVLKSTGSGWTCASDSDTTTPGDGAGVTSIGLLDSTTASANGASIGGGGSVLYLQSASNTNAGLVNTGAQTFGGAKTFAVQATFSGGLAISTGQSLALGTTCGAGEVLGTDGTGVITCVTDAVGTGDGVGVTTVGVIDSQTKHANGAVISGSNIYFQTADALAAGLVSTTAQTFGGAKTFNNQATFSGGLSVAANQALAGSGNLTVSAANNATLTLGTSGTGALYLSGYNCSVSGGGGKLTVDATGKVNCAADGDTDTTGITEVTAGNGIAVTGGNQVSVQLRAGYGLAFDAISPFGVGLSECTVNQILKSNGSGWACGDDIDTDTGDGQGVTTIGALDGGTASANGASLSVDGSTIYFQSATALRNGIVTTTSQAFAGTKTFNDGIVIASGQTVTLGTACTVGNVLKTDATGVIICSADEVGTDSDTGVNAIGALDGRTRTANGATIDGRTIYLQTADGTNSGLVSSGTQTFGGAKTFSGAINANGGITTNNASINAGTGTVTAGTLTTGALNVSGSVSQTGTGTFSTGTGAISLNGATTVSGNLTLTGSQFTNNASTVNTTLALGNFATDVTIGTAASTVNIKTTISIAQTTAGRTLTMPSPTDVAAGRVVYVLNTGTAVFTMHGVSIAAGYGQIYVWNGTSWILGASGGGSSISLQAAYDGGNTINTTDARNIAFTLANTTTDANYVINVASGSTGQFKIQNNGVDVMAIGSTGQLQLATQGSTGGLLMGGDVSLYRSAANTLMANSSAIFKNATDGANALVVQSAAGTNVFTVDTTTKSVSVGAPVTYNNYTYSSSAGFSAPIHYPAVNPVDVPVAGDFDNDGDNDFVVVQDNTSDTFAVFNNLGNGTFDTKVEYGVFVDSAPLARVADLNNDNLDDVVVFSSGTNGSVRAFLSTGGGFTASTSITGISTRGAELLDVTNDGNIDLILITATGSVQVRPGNGNGTFGTATSYAALANGVDIAVADVDGDSDKDIIAASSNLGPIALLLNNGNGTYTQGPNPSSVNQTYYKVYLADLNNDSRQDIIAATASAFYVSLGNGDGSFQAQVSTSFNNGSGGRSLAIIDTDSDGSLDVVSNRFGTVDEIVMRKGNGDGTFQAETNIYTQSIVGSYSLFVSAGDFNNDNKMDLMVPMTLFGSGTTNDAVLVFINSNQLNVATMNAAISSRAVDINSTALTLQGATGQVADILRVQDSATEVLFQVANNGNIGIGSVNDLASQVHKLNVEGSINATALYQQGNMVCSALNNCGYIKDGTTAQTASFNITGSATASAFRLNGTDINTGGTLSNVVYEDQSNVFTGQTNSFNSSTTGSSAVAINANSLTSGSALQITTTSGDLVSGKLIDVNQVSTYNNNYSTTNGLMNLSRTVGTVTQTSVINQIGTVSSGFSTNSANAGQQYFTFSHTVPAGSDKVLFVALASCFNTMTVTYNGIAMTKHSSGTNATGSSCNGADGGGFGTVSYYYLVNPPVGTYTVAVTTGSTAAQYAGAYAMTFENVSQTSPIDAAATGNPSTINVQSHQVGLDVYLGTAGGAYNPAPGGSQIMQSSVIGGGPFRMGASKTPTSASLISQMSWEPSGGGTGIWDHMAIRINPAVVPGVGSASGDLVNFTNSCNSSTTVCTDTTTVLNLNQAVTTSTGSVLNIQNAGTGYGLQVGGGKSLFSGTSGSGWNAAAATLYVGRDTGTLRSINAAGTIGASGADYAEWIPWSGTKPEPGTVITYKGSTFVVSSLETAAIAGNDAIDTDNAILIAFMGQLPVKVTGAVSEGDILVANGDGTARAIPQSDATLTDFAQRVGIAWESSTDSGVKKIRAAVGTSASGSLASNMLQGAGSFESLNVSGNATIQGKLVVRGTIEVQDIIVNGHVITASGKPTSDVLGAAGNGATVVIDGNDTTGTITVTTGSTPTAGELFKILFSEIYGKTPRIVISASSDTAAELRFFKGTTDLQSFMFNSKNAPLPNTEYRFDYFIAE